MSQWSDKMDQAIDQRTFGYFQVFNSILDPDMGLSDTDFFIYCKICRHAGNGPKAYFSLGKLKKHMKWGNTTVSQSIKRLKALGLIEATLTQKGYLFTLIGSVADFMTSPAGKAKVKKIKVSPVGKAGFLSGEGRFPVGGNKEYTNKNTPITIPIKKAAKAAPTHLLASKWCEYVGIKVELLTGKDWKALGDLSKVGIEFDSLKGMSEKAWKAEKKNLAYLNSHRADLSSGKTTLKGRRYKTIDDLLEEEALERKEKHLG